MMGYADRVLVLLGGVMSGVLGIVTGLFWGWLLWR